ncbi:hypothetical protein D9M71_421930 [compost metagenome]
MHRSAPGVVEHHQRAVGVGDLGDAGHVLHLEGQGAGGFEEDDTGVGANQFGDAAADQRVVVGGLDAEALERLVAEGAGRVVDRIGHQQVVAGLERGQQGGGQGAQAAGREHGAMGALQFGQGALQGAGGGVAMATVGVEGAVLGVQGFDGGEEQGRGAVDRSIHGATDQAPFTAFMGQQRFQMQLAVIHLGISSDSG